MGSAFGKVILFGEHFVVYGIPAVASAIDKQARVEAREADAFSVDVRKGLDDKAWAKGVAEAVAKHLGIEGSFALTVDSDIPVGQGLGSSAAFAVATARALSECFSVDLSDEAVSAAAYEGEKISHGTPSGIDNTAATYGGLVWFKKDLAGGKPTVEAMTIPEPLEIAIGVTGKKGNTKELVAAVRERKEKNPETFERIFADAEALVGEATKALLDGKTEKVGELMNRNHELLSEIGVSTMELDEMCAAAREAGALGAKLAGAGGGGIMIALCPGRQEAVAKAIEGLGFEVYRTRIGV